MASGTTSSTRSCGMADVWVVAFQVAGPSRGLRIGHWGDEHINVTLARPGDGAFMASLDDLDRIWHGAFDAGGLRTTGALVARWAVERAPGAGGAATE